VGVEGVLKSSTMYGYGKRKVHYHFPKTIMTFQITVKHQVPPFPPLGCSSWSISIECVRIVLHPSDTLNLASR